MIYEYGSALYDSNVKLLITELASAGISYMGSDPVHRLAIDGWFSIMLIPNPERYFANHSVIVSFEYYTERADMTCLQVFRPMGDMQYELVYSLEHVALTTGLQEVDVS